MEAFLPRARVTERVKLRNFWNTTYGQTLLHAALIALLSHSLCLLAGSIGLPDTATCWTRLCASQHHRQPAERCRCGLRCACCIILHNKPALQHFASSFPGGAVHYFVTPSTATHGCKLISPRCLHSILTCRVVRWILPTSHTRPRADPPMARCQRARIPTSIPTLRYGRRLAPIKARPRPLELLSPCLRDPLLLRQSVHIPQPTRKTTSLPKSRRLLLPAGSHSTFGLQLPRTSRSVYPWTSPAMPQQTSDAMTRPFPLKCINTTNIANFLPAQTLLK